MNIILIGYMGSGKTTLGKKLAKRLNLRFLDTDREIEWREKKSIPEIFDSLGADGFRELEKQLIAELQSKDNVLISTGGGMPCFNDLMRKLNAFGTTIYLKRPAKELANRIYNSKKKRPITDGKTQEELVLLIDKMLEERAPFYEQAAIVADREIQNITTLELLIKAHQLKNKTQ